LKLHDELAEVNKKYGLARGESVARTGAQHKSYLQWLEEQVDKNDETIEQQRQLLYDINKEVKKAETRLKGLTTMLDNLEKHRLDVLADIELLENDVAESETEKEELDKKLRQLKTDLQLTEDKIAEREAQLLTATEELRELNHNRAELQQDYDDMQRKINREMPALQQKTYHDMEAIGWEVAAQDAIERSSQMEAFRSELPPELETKFNSLFDGSMFEAMATHAAEMPPGDLPEGVI
jgi:chromosome segregation ATPase